jgi:hypothetical protein
LMSTIAVIAPASNTKPISEPPVPHRQVYAYLAGKGWQAIHELALVFRNDSCVSRDPTGRELKYTAIMRKIHRSADDLVEGGLVAEDFIPFRNGEKRRVRRFDET